MIWEDVPGGAERAWYLENTTELIVNVHPPAFCAGAVCAIHNRSDHRLREYPQHYDGHGMVRICPHGVRHPDPDDHHIRTGRDRGVHECDGCCLSPEERRDLGFDD